MGHVAYLLASHEMRVYFLYGLILVAMVLSTRRWILGVCGTIVLAAISQHEDMPRSLGGITGLSPANILLGWTCIMFVLQRNAHLEADPSLPMFAMVLFGMYGGAIVLAYLQGVLDLRSLQGPTGFSDLASFTGFTVEFLINPFKILLPAALVYLGIRSRQDFWLILGALGIMALLLAIVTLRNMPLGTLFDEGAFMARRHRIQRQTGLHANDLALIMVQAVWAASLVLRRHVWGWRRWIVAACLVMFLLSLALCHSRAGFLAVTVTGLVVGMACWKKLLLGLPAFLVIAGVSVPSIRARVMMGIGAQSGSYSEVDEMDHISAGRTSSLWPAATAQIAVAPLMGAGRLTILRTEMFERIESATGDECPTHPHNAYLEMLCDSGFVTLIPFLAGMTAAGGTAIRMSRRRENLNAVLVGALGIVAVVPVLVMGLSGQSFWPEENVFPAACLIAAFLRGWASQQASFRRPAHASVSP